MNHSEEKNIISFGNYLLSKERNDSVSEINKNNVTHADLENWKNETEYLNMSPRNKKRLNQSIKETEKLI